ncbi:MAG TPA: tRNA lysidine(34) synthetase TilS, partial [Clostridia bacterium]|nr:tRNA lysidine(34) synthetase TilS [Clostridia bacterium]
NMLEPHDKIVVGVSGGADSIALIHIMDKIKDQIPMELFIAHIDHGLRGDAAREDSLFVKNIARDMGYRFFLKEAQVSKLSQDWKMSEEEAGREVRYKFFQEVLEEVQGQKIALAHHRDDQVETILYNIIRGTGLAGLSGMKPLRDNLIIRPLLDVSRMEIEEYCHDNGFTYRDDHTNDEITYTRNRIRHLVIPMIEKDFNPNFSNTLVRMGDILRDEEEFIAEHSQYVFKKIAKVEHNQVKLELDALCSCPRALMARIIRNGLQSLKGNLVGLEYVHLDNIMDLLLNSQVGSTLDLPSGIRATKDYSYLVLSIGAIDEKLMDYEYHIDIPGERIIPELDMKISIEKAKEMGVSDKDSKCIYIDLNRVMGNISVRNRRQGDRFKPLGMKGIKKIKDFFIDKKISRQDRDGIALLVDRYNNKENIIWIAGHQMSEDYKVTRETKELLKLEIQLLEN